MTDVNWQYCKNLNDINHVIMYGHEDWEGLTSADDIISITYNPNHACYVVFWKMKSDKNTAQKTGHWHSIQGNSAVCSCCNRNNIIYGDYCKWCGSKND